MQWQEIPVDQGFKNVCEFFFWLFDGHMNDWMVL